MATRHNILLQHKLDVAIAVLVVVVAAAAVDDDDDANVT